jgi:hypothetical protein
MSGFMEFDSFDDMVEFMRTNTEQANAGLAPEQQALTWGSTWVRFDQVFDENIVFGRCYEREEAKQKERDATVRMGDRVDEYEIADTDRRLAAALEDGYLFGVAASRHFPDPEIGSTHRANAWPISDRLFQTMEQLGFDYQKLTDPVLREELEDAYREWREHEMTRR